ncbi:MAG: DUF4391 domain-containing protein [Methanobacteriaceae archaeon]|nr:DUF4391 domain-containing protein [Methanobacteriaceae archaeon]
MAQIKEFLDIPASCDVNNVIFKKLLYEKMELKKADRDILTKYVDKILWCYSLKENNINIKKFKDEKLEYDEIEFINVYLKAPNKLKRLADIIMRIIPYPMLLSFEYGNEIRIFTGHQRISLADNSKNTIEEYIYTDWIDLNNLDEIDKELFEGLKLQNLSFTNFYSFYNDIIGAIIKYNTSKLSGGSSIVLPIDEMKNIYDEIKAIDYEIDILRSQIQKETQFNRMVELNMEIKRLKDNREELRGILN